jgi:hypothetical protein
MSLRIRFVVVNEDTLGYVSPRQPGDYWPLGGSLRRPLATIDGGRPIGASDVLRDATAQDFRAYRVAEAPEQT